jgi:tRNA nucleotidyltransferase (CCA-adding enzyme)
MADYIYLLENRLSAAQQSALLAIREIARTRGLTVFLVGGAVRDLTSGSPVRDLDVAVQGNALKLRKDLEKIGAQIAGEYEPAQALFARFPGNVRMEVSSTLTATYPKPGKPKFEAAAILDDLRRRDFTANAMALSLNEGSYGLLMDPLNGIADIENRELRLVSNYGFIEDPIRMVRAARLSARLGWQLEEKTQQRYETGKAEGYISAMNDFQRGYELEETVHEEDPLRVLQRLESEGWVQVLCPEWTTAKANVAELEKLREAQGQLQTQGILADASAAQFPLLTAKMAPKDVASLKQSFPRQGFVAEIEGLEAEAKQLATELGSKQASTASATWRIMFSAPPEVLLWVAYSTRSTALQAKFKSFYSEWPAARQRIPYALMQEMRILPELPGYNELVERIFFELMDARLGTVEEMKAFLEPYSPPAPPPPVNMRRARGAKAARVTKGKKRVETSGDADSDVPLDIAGEVSDAVGGSDLADEVAEGAEAVEAAPSKAVPSKAAPAHKAAPPKSAPVTEGPPKAVPAKVVAAKPAPAKVVASSSAHKSAPAAKGPAAKNSGKLTVKEAAKSAGVVGKKPVAAKTGPSKAAAKKGTVAKKPAGKSGPVVAKSGKPTPKAGKAAAKVPAKKPGSKPVAAKGAKASGHGGKAAPAKKSAPAKKAKKR